MQYKQLCSRIIVRCVLFAPLSLDWFLQVNPRHRKTSHTQCKSCYHWRSFGCYNILWVHAYYQSPQVQARYRQPEQTVVVNVDVEDEAGTVKGTELIALKPITHSPPQEEALSSASRSRVSTKSVSPSPTPTRTSKPKERRERASSQPLQEIWDMDVSKYVGSVGRLWLSL